MKKSKGIQLVLITAALASCSREWVPRQSIAFNPRDSSLTAAPAGGADPSDDSTADPFTGPLQPCNCLDPTVQLWNYSFNPFGTYYSGPVGSVFYYPRVSYGKGSFWRGHSGVVRGGLGKSAFSGGA